MKRNPATFTATEFLRRIQAIAPPELAAWISANERGCKKVIKAALRDAGRLSRSSSEVKTASDERLVIFRMGLGRDSLAMLGLLCEGGLLANGVRLKPDDIDAVVFTDPGQEWSSTYALASDVQRICNEYGLRFLYQRKPPIPQQQAYVRAVRKAGTMKGVPRPWRRVEPATIEEKCKSGWYHIRPGIMTDYASRNSIIQYKDAGCTGNHKIAPNRALIDDLSRERWGIDNSTWSTLVNKGLRQPHLVLLGIAADEAHRAIAGERGPKYETNAYPLVEMGVSKAMEADVLKRWNLNHAHKSGCVMCKYQSEAWFWALSVVEPERFAAAVEYERNALEGGEKTDNKQYLFPKTKGPDGKPMRIAQVVASWRAKNPAVTVEQIMRKDYKRNDTATGQAIPKAQRAVLADTSDGTIDGTATGEAANLARLGD